MHSSAIPALKTIVYVDSFNLYYGCLKGTAYKWLDLAKLVSLLLPNHQVEKIKYFTAKMVSTPHKPSRSTNQQIYLRALATMPSVEITYGRFLSSTVRMPCADPAAKPRTVEVIKTEEKGSDVNLAAHLLMDAVDNAYDLAVVVSNDSDLLLPIQWVRDRFKKKVGILNPQQKHSFSLRQNTDWMRPIRQGPLSAAQFSDELQDRDGIFRKPPKW